MSVGSIILSMHRQTDTFNGGLVGQTGQTSDQVGSGHLREGGPGGGCDSSLSLDEEGDSCQSSSSKPLRGHMCVFPDS